MSLKKIAKRRRRKPTVVETTVAVEMRISPKKKAVKSKKGKEKISTVMEEFKEGKLKSGSRNGPKVKSRKQAIAIALSEARNLKKKSSKKKSSKK